MSSIVKAIAGVALIVVGVAIAGTPLGVLSPYLIGFGISLVLGAATDLLLGGADDPSLIDPTVRSRGQTANVRQPITHWRVIYGMSRVGGPITFSRVTADINGNKNENFYILNTVACHEVDAFLTLWFGEHPIQPAEDGDAGGQWNNLWRNDTNRSWSVYGRGESSVSDTFTVDDTTDIITLGSDLSLVTGELVYLSTTTTLPTGYDLLATRSYHWRAISSTTGTLHKSYEYACSNHNIVDATDTGSGTHTLTRFSDGDLHERLTVGIDNVGGVFQPGVGTEFWSSSHLQTGHAKVLLLWNYKPKFFSKVSSLPPVNWLIRGKRLFDTRDSTTVWSHNPVLCLYDYLTDTEYGLGIPAAELNTTSFDTAANVCEEQVSTEISRTFTAVAGTDLITLGTANTGATTGDKVVLTTTGTLPDPLATGTDYYWFAVTASPTTTGKLAIDEDNARAGTIIDILDTGTGTHTFTRIGSTDFTIDDTDDTDVVHMAVKIPQLQTGDGIEVETTSALPSGLSVSTTYYFSELSIHGTGLPDSVAVDYRGYICSSYANALAQVPVSISDAGTGTHKIVRKSEPRYTCNGIFSTDSVPKTIINQILACMAGTLTHIGSTWSVFAGEYRTPTVTIDESILEGNLAVRLHASRRLLFNGIKGTYTSPNDDWTITDFPRVTNATYKTEDNEEENFSDLDLPFTSSASMAQRLAKILLERSRQHIMVTMPCNLKAYDFKPGEVVNVTNTRLAWVAKPFEVVNWGLAVREEGTDNAHVGVDLVLHETASGIYDWNAGEETSVDLAPNSDFGEVLDPAAPTNMVLASGTAHLFVRSDGTVFSRLYVTWTAPLDGYVIDGGQIEIQFKLASASTWLPYTFTNGSVEAAYILDVDDGSLYDVRIRSVNSYGVPGDTWVSVTGFQVFGKTVAPSDVPSLSVHPIGDVVTFIWGKVTDSDLTGYELRYETLTDTFDWDNATVITSVTKGTLVTNSALLDGSWTVGIKAIDTSGNYSVNATTFDVTVTLVTEPPLQVVATGAWQNRPHDFGRLQDTATITRDAGALSDATTHIIDLGTLS